MALFFLPKLYWNLIMEHILKIPWLASIPNNSSDDGKNYLLYL